MKERKDCNCKKSDIKFPVEDDWESILDNYRLDRKYYSKSFYEYLKKNYNKPTKK